ncbi:ATP-binding cassette domain-containing protein [Granulicatella elegans]|uniref:ABC transporter ATP-binding protein n=1 Tax=Granulicatella elegans TaxID=137732 RepID=UPI001D1349F2|nr:ABC transporter ATP-binding protein [Granulicatella elegans]UEA31076.1 ABC transporter ATP-binding protein [Granulicatella elegans]
MITLSNVTIKTRQTIIENIDFTFNKGKVYGIVAINGSGKTTLFRAISQLIPVNSGNITTLSSFFYYENIEWFDLNLSGIDYLNYIKNIWKSTQSLNDEIDFWEMNDFIYLPIRKYSLGMKQRLLIAMYFISQAECWLMDEITNGLDEYFRTKFFNRIDKLNRENHLIILTSHYKEDLSKVCDKLLTIENGEIKEGQL